MFSRFITLIIIIAVLFSCSDSKKKVDKEEYPDFSKDEKGATASDVAPRVPRNTESFHTVEIKQMKFVPDVLHVHAGDTVLWINSDITDHDVTEEILLVE
jgi:plastocyanin